MLNTVMVECFFSIGCDSFLSLDYAVGSLSMHVPFFNVICIDGGGECGMVWKNCLIYGSMEHIRRLVLHCIYLFLLLF